MAEFLEERLPIGVRMGASFADEYNVEITQTAAGAEYRRLVHAYPRRVFNVHYTQTTANLWDQIIALYHRAYGMFAGFRVKAMDDYTTNARIGAPTATDQALSLVSAGIYQLQVKYGTLGGTPLPSIGAPVRIIYKPVANTVLIAIGSQTQTLGWSVSTLNGRVTFAANKTRAITAITNAASAVVTVGAHTFLVGESVHFSGVVGMTQINNLRGLISAITGTTFTVSIDSTLFGVYTSGGTANTNPQSGEVVNGGCEFDIPCRFNSRIDVNILDPSIRESGQIEIVELLAP